MIQTAAYYPGPGVRSRGISPARPVRGESYEQLVARHRQESASRRAAAAVRIREGRRVGDALEFLTGSRRPGLESRYAGSGVAAWHEAGHVVAGWALGFDVTVARVDRDGRCGETGIAQRLDDPDTMTVAWAGLCAESLAPGWVPEFAELHDDTDDAARFEALADRYYPIARMVAASRALRIVTERVELVAVVAEALGSVPELWRGQLDEIRAVAG